MPGNLHCRAVFHKGWKTRGNRDNRKDFPLFVRNSEEKWKWIQNQRSDVSKRGYWRNNNLVRSQQDMELKIAEQGWRPELPAANKSFSSQSDSWVIFFIRNQKGIEGGKSGETRKYLDLRTVQVKSCNNRSSADAQKLFLLWNSQLMYIYCTRNVSTRTKYWIVQSGMVLILQ